MKRVLRAGLGLLLLQAGALLSGCAQFPEGLIGTGRTLVDMRMTVRGVVDPNAYYLFVIDTDGVEATGPEIIAPQTQFLGNGRATGSYTHYVEYHLGRFELFRDQPEQEGVDPPPRTSLGEPFFFDADSSTGSLSATIALDQLRANADDPDPTQLEINLITVDRILLPGEVPIEPRQTDGLGPQGTNYLIVRPENGLIIVNENIEEAGEFIGGQPIEPAYDLTDFRIAIRTGS